MNDIVFPFSDAIIFVSDKVIPEPKHLPCLVVNPELTFFSSNAAICYFLPPQTNVSSNVYDWLEWEAKILCTTLVQLGGSAKTESIKTTILNLLKLIEEKVSNDYLVGVSLKLIKIHFIKHFLLFLFKNSRKPLQLQISQYGPHYIPYISVKIHRRNF